MPWRRFITIPGYIIAWLAWLAAAPIWIAVAVVMDLVRGNGGVALRSAALVALYLSCEVIGMVVSGGIWLWSRVVHMESERWIDLHFRLEAWWGTTLFQGVVKLFGLRLEIEGDADLGRGPYILLLRHSSTADTLLASALVARPYGVRLRYVLKREHLWDPCLDIVGNRVPNAFVDRFAEDSAGEIRRVQGLARDLGSHGAILIYPEGTRFSHAKRARVLERLKQGRDRDLFEFARSQTAVLPPRYGGTLGLLEALPDADVVICAHTGFEGTASLGDIWRGALLNQVIRIQFRRIPRSDIPVDRDAQTAWILDEWRRVGAWVEKALARSPENEDRARGRAQGLNGSSHRGRVVPRSRAEVERSGSASQNELHDT